MLGQIETGKSAPTVNLLWKVEKPWVKTLVEAYHSPEVKAFVADKFKGSVIAAW